MAIRPLVTRAVGLEKSRHAIRRQGNCILSESPKSRRVRHTSDSGEVDGALSEARIVVWSARLSVSTVVQINRSAKVSSPLGSSY